MSDFLTNDELNKIVFKFMEKLEKQKYQGPYVLKINHHFTDPATFGKIPTGSAFTDVYLECNDVKIGEQVDLKIYPQEQ